MPTNPLGNFFKRWKSLELKLRLDTIQEGIDQLMSLVQIEQDDLQKFATEIVAEFSAVNSAVTVLADYIKKLVAGQAAPLPAADESDINNALASLSNAVSNLTALQPPQPTS